MGAKDRQSHDQKRKAKLAKRAAKTPANDVTPYDGKKYQVPGWAPFVHATERPVYDTIVLSGRTLTNETVRKAFVQSIRLLRTGEPAALPEGAPEVAYSAGTEVEYLVYAMRSSWRAAQDKYVPIPNSDWVGILRTLLNSIEAHAWHTGPSRGYVAFLEKFVQQSPVLGGGSRVWARFGRGPSPGDLLPPGTD